ncbi:tyrosine-type recombinase/integrase [Petrocella sp. FN5]|uniref:tyrosine-type recombinase/integrase n=1 Tax=Petrocella sp. FN5 TaxID=3032002 RepID=UPI0023DB7A63|nr:tyrosine-type recombinase/integrase [Petrocella sp. FN5]MDF1618722.1 tyrosine-type recombinase/integrase [Petrocella sp. FN5]
MDLRASTFAWNTYRLDYYRLSSLDRFLCSRSFDQIIVSQELINDWLVEYKVPTASINGYLKTLRAFMGYRRNLGLPVYLPPYRKQQDSYIPYFFSDKELNAIIKYADILETIRPGLITPDIYLKIPMIIRVLYSTGLRLNEVLCLKMKNVNFENGVLTIVNAKHDKQRLVPIHATLNETLYKYCIFLGITLKPDAFVFSGMRSGTHMSPSVVQKHFKFILKYLGIISGYEDKHERGPCLHCLRHCFILLSFKQLEKNGITVDLSFPYLSVYCGHVSLIATEKYMKFSSEMFDSDMTRFTDFSDHLFPEVEL